MSENFWYDFGNEELLASIFLTEYAQYPDPVAGQVSATVSLAIPPSPPILYIYCS